MANGIWKGIEPLVIGHSEQFLLNKYFDLRIHFMRNIKPPAKSKMAAKVPQNGQRDPERGLTQGKWVL